MPLDVVKQGNTFRLKDRDTKKIVGAPFASMKEARAAAAQRKKPKAERMFGKK